MKSDTAIDRMKRELHRALDHTRIDLDRIEILTAAMSAFSKPVPEYEPQFQHMQGLALTRHEINQLSSED